MQRGTRFPLLTFGLYKKPQRIVPPKQSSSALFQLDSPFASFEEQSYLAKVRTILQEIQWGNTYQVNLTYRLKVPFVGDTEAFFWELARAQPSPYSFFLDTDAYAVCSASPELFFDYLNGELTSSPMKGTCKRGRYYEEDEVLRKSLSMREKERAENVMIVDMVRNDMARLARVSDIEVPALFTTERYPTLHQMTSTVRCRTDASVTEILSVLFPFASITGAPKPKTMELIASLEETPRGIYTGALGIIDPLGQARFSVAIRTTLIDKSSKELEYGVGGGIVADSEPLAELEELKLKTSILVPNTISFQLLETCLWRPNGYFLLDEHLERLKTSVTYFCFTPFSGDKLKDDLLQLSQSFSQTSKVIRILLDCFGKFSLEVKEWENETAGKATSVCLDSEPVDSSSVFLFHKTTHRRRYDEATGRHPHVQDVLLFNERGELTESTRANVVADSNQRFITPPVHCGLLNGVMRRHLLHTGVIEEQIISLKDLQHIRALYLVNFLRGWQRVLETPSDLF